jgi:glucose/arabinose dehydrogenase
MSWLESGREMAWSGWRVGKTTWRRSVAVGVLAVAMVAAILAPTRQAVALPAGFHEHVVFTGLNQPTNLEFAQDGRVFVAEQSGVIKVYDNLVDRTATVFADLSTVVHKQADRGLLGLALPPRFPVTPWVYVFYTYDAPPGQTAPVYNDVCAEPTGGNCVVTSRLSRLPITADGSAGAEQVLIHDFCQQYPSHSVGDLRFGADGTLYVSSGDGAHFFATDWGQFGTPRNPCGDAPGGVGGAMDPPTAEGGALRAQDVRTTADPTALNGSVLRLNPETGEAMAGNPLIGSADPNARRVVAHGLRNPFRMAVRPGTGELWIADVGWDTWESVERLARPTAKVTNFGWPCYEGPDRSLTTTTTTPTRWSPVRTARPVRRRSAGWPSTPPEGGTTRTRTPVRSFSPIPSGNASGRCGRGSRAGCLTPPASRRLPRAWPPRWTSRSARVANCTIWTSVARFGGLGTDRATSRRPW